MDVFPRFKKIDSLDTLTGYSNASDYLKMKTFEEHQQSRISMIRKEINV